jgi:hypothetical protein
MAGHKAINPFTRAGIRENDLGGKNRKSLSLMAYLTTLTICYLWLCSGLDAAKTRDGLTEIGDFVLIST